MITFTDKELSDVEQPESDLLRVLTTERHLLGSKMREARTCGPLFRLSEARVGSAAGCRLAETRERVQAAHQGVATYVGRRTLRGF
jgi:hypothetical protein